MRLDSLGPIGCEKASQELWGTLARTALGGNCEEVMGKEKMMACILGRGWKSHLWPGAQQEPLPGRV